MPSHSMIAIFIESVFVQWVGSGSFKKSDFFRCHFFNSRYVGNQPVCLLSGFQVQASAVPVVGLEFQISWLPWAVAAAAFSAYLQGI